MKIVGQMIVRMGCLGFFIGAVFSSEECWMITPIIFLCGVISIAAGMYLIKAKAVKDEIREQQAYERATRHDEDADKLRLSQDMRDTYQKIIIERIWGK